MSDEVWITLSDPDITSAEMHAVAEVMQSPRLTGGPAVAAFEAAFAAYLGATTRSLSPAEQSDCSSR